MRVVQEERGKQMSITTARQTFATALGAKASCIAARMDYDNSAKAQVFKFDVVPASGSTVTVEVTVPAHDSIDTTIAAAGRDYASTLEG